MEKGGPHSLQIYPKNYVYQKCLNPFNWAKLLFFIEEMIMEDHTASKSRTICAPHKLYLM